MTPNIITENHLKKQAQTNLPRNDDFAPINAFPAGSLDEAWWRHQPKIYRRFLELNTEAERNSYADYLRATGRGDGINIPIMIWREPLEVALANGGESLNPANYPPAIDFAVQAKPFTWRRKAAPEPVGPESGTAPEWDLDGVGATYTPNRDDHSEVGSVWPDGDKQYVKLFDRDTPGTGFSFWQRVK